MRLEGAVYSLFRIFKAIQQSCEALPLRRTMDGEYAQNMVDSHGKSSSLRFMELSSNPQIPEATLNLTFWYAVVNLLITVLF